MTLLKKYIQDHLYEEIRPHVHRCKVCSLTIHDIKFVHKTESGQKIETYIRYLFFMGRKRVPFLSCAKACVLDILE